VKKTLVARLAMRKNRIVYRLVASAVNTAARDVSVQRGKRGTRCEFQFVIEPSLRGPMDVEHVLFNAVVLSDVTIRGFTGAAAFVSSIVIRHEVVAQAQRDVCVCQSVFDIGSENVAPFIDSVKGGHDAADVVWRWQPGEAGITPTG